MTRRLSTRKWTALCMGMAVMAATMLLTACAVERDNLSFNNPLGDKIYGTWYADYKAEGTVGVDNTPYSRVLQAVKYVMGVA